MTNEFEQKTWPAEASWLGRQLANGEAVDAEALATSAAATGISREALNGAAAEIHAIALRNNVGLWRLESQFCGYWAAYRDGFDAASGAASTAAPKSVTPTDAGGKKPGPAVVQRIMNAGYRAGVFARRQQAVEAARAAEQDAGKTEARPTTADEVYARRSREARHGD
jgi:hypothetical protein